MKGFFSNQALQSSTAPNGKTLSCASCGLYQHAQSPRMAPFGNFKKRILNIGEAPEEIEDQKGKQWQGKAGRRLQRVYRSLGIDLFEDCLNINSVNCHSANSKEPSLQEIACCRQRVLKVIEQYKPHVIILFGNTAVTSIIGHRWKKDLGGIMKWRGWRIPDRELNAWICPVFHPSFVEKSDSAEVDVIWIKDLERAVSAVHVPFPVIKDDMKCVEIIEGKDFMQSSLYPTPEIASFDYETTGIKPHAPGHRVVCASVCANENHVQAFLIPNKKSERTPFLSFLLNPNIKKMAHNMKFEHAWSLVRLRTEVQGWYWDSMLAAHILDNRQGITGLKFQTYVNFGVADYSSEMDPYLKGKDSKNGNNINRVLEIAQDPVKYKKLLEYCALDSLYQFRLSQKQMEMIR